MSTSTTMTPTTTSPPKIARITTAQAYILQYNLKGYKLSYGTINNIQSLLLKLTDADGFTGWGEANPQQPFTVESIDDVSSTLEHVLLPQVLSHPNPMPALIDTLLDTTHPTSHLIAKGTISMALLDIQGKHLHLPAATLLSPTIHHTSLPVLWPLSDQPASADIAVMTPKIAQGYHTFMLKMGARDPTTNSANIHSQVDRITTLTTHFAHHNPPITLIADANTGWTLKETQLFLSLLPHDPCCPIAFLEQPLPPALLPSLTSSSSSPTSNPSAVPISADESVTSLASAQALLSPTNNPQQQQPPTEPPANNQAASTKPGPPVVDILSIKASKNGGPLRCATLCDLAAAHDVKVYMNSMLELGVSQAASLAVVVGRENLVPGVGHAFMSTLRLGDEDGGGDVTDFGRRVREGSVYWDEERWGLGVEVDEGELERRAVGGFVVRAS